jgi:hypothetical protein
VITKIRLIPLLVLAALLAWFVWGLYASARQASLNKQLVAAVGSGNVVAVQRLLRVGADPNTREGGDSPPNWWGRLAAMLGRGPGLRHHLGTPVLIPTPLEQLLYRTPPLFDDLRPPVEQRPTTHGLGHPRQHPAPKLLHRAG